MMNRYTLGLILSFVLGFTTASLIEAVKDYREIVRKLEQPLDTIKIIIPKEPIEIERDRILEEQIQKQT